MKLAMALVSLLAGCGLPAPGGWIGATPDLHVRPELIDRHPAVLPALQQAAREYCERGYRCVDIRAGYGHNEVRLGGVTACDANRVCIRARVKTKGTKRIMVFYDVTPFGESLEFVSEDQPCSSRWDARALHVARHELGHWLGFEHTPNTPEYRDYVMYPTTACEFDQRIWP